MLRCVVVVALVAAMQPRTVDACSCGGGTIVSPQNGAIVPTNAAIILFSRSFLETPRIEVRVRGTTIGVPITAEVEQRPDRNDMWIVARPTLEADTDYEVIVETAPSSQPSPFETIQFRTGNTALEPISFSGLLELQTEVMHWPFVQPDGSLCTSSCTGDINGTIARLRLRHDDPSHPAVLMVVSLFRNGELVDELALAPYGLAFLESGNCRATFALVENAEYCASLRAYDAAGNQAGSDRIQCATTRTCASRLSEADTCSPSSECTEPSEQPAGNGGCATSNPGLGLIASLCGLLACRRRRPEDDEASGVS